MENAMACKYFYATYIMGYFQSQIIKCTVSVPTKNFKHLFSEDLFMKSDQINKSTKS